MSTRILPSLSDSTSNSAAFRLIIALMEFSTLSCLFSALDKILSPLPRFHSLICLSVKTSSGSRYFLKKSTISVKFRYGDKPSIVLLDCKNAFGLCIPGYSPLSTAETNSIAPSKAAASNTLSKSIKPALHKVSYKYPAVLVPVGDSSPW